MRTAEYLLKALMHLFADILKKESRMIFSKKTFFTGLSLLFAVSANAQIIIHSDWTNLTNTKRSMNTYDFSATQLIYPLMTVPQGDVKYARFSLNHPSSKCFHAQTRTLGPSMDTKIWAENGTQVYSDDKQGGSSLYAGFMWWSNGDFPFNFRIAAYSPAYNSGTFRLDINEITSATTAAACSLYTTDISFVRGNLVRRFF